MSGVTLLNDNDFEVLNFVFLRKMASLSQIVSAVERDESMIKAAVDRFVHEGKLFDSDGTFMVTEEGRAVVVDEYARRYAEYKDHPFVNRWYKRFEGLNERFLEAMSSWQTIKVGNQSLPNDHSDPDYDNRVLSKVETIVSRMIERLDEIKKFIPRYSHYQRRFTAALQKVNEGSLDYLVSPMLDSLHNIWFEFHEDILLVQGIRRELVD